MTDQSPGLGARLEALAASPDSARLCGGAVVRIELCDTSPDGRPIPIPGSLEYVGAVDDPVNQERLASGVESYVFGLILRNCAVVYLDRERQIRRPDWWKT